AARYRPRASAVGRVRCLGTPLRAGGLPRLRLHQRHGRNRRSEERRPPRGRGAQGQDPGVPGAFARGGRLPCRARSRFPSLARRRRGLRGARGFVGARAPRPPTRGAPAERRLERAMKSVSLYSAEPARGWLPPGALAPFLGIALVALPDVAGTLL